MIFVALSGRGIGVGRPLNGLAKRFSRFLERDG